jgi:hypothetical protein
MASPGATLLADLDGLLKRNYDKNFITDQQQTDPDFMQTMPTASEKPAGEDGFRFGVRMERRQNGGAQNQDEQFRTNETGVRKQATIAPKVNIWAIELTNLAIAASSGNEYAFGAGLDDEMRDSLAMFKKDVNRQLFGWGAGALTAANGSVSASVSMTVDSTQYLYAGMRIDVYSSTTLQASNVKISSINHSTKVVTLALAITCSDNADIYRAGVYLNKPTDGKEMMGLQGISDDNTLFTTFQGLSRATYEIWKGTVIDASSTALTNDILQRSADAVEFRSGTQVNRLVSHRVQRRAYLNIATPLKRFNDDKLDTGFQTMSWNGIEWMVSHDCQKDYVYLYNKDLVKKYVLFDIKLDDSDGKVIKHIPRYDIVEAYYKMYANCGCKHPAGVGRIENLTTLSEL